MSDKQQLEGFLNEQSQVQKRIASHKKLIASFQTQPTTHQQPNKMERYVGMSTNLKVEQNDSQEDSDVDMFSIEPNKKIKENQKLEGQEVTDQSGYYNIYSGKTVSAGKYKIIDKIGKGMFGVVAKAEVTDTKQKYIALKIIRKNEMMTLSGEKQYKILSSLQANAFIVGIKDYFYEQGHLFLAAELMGPDLRSYVRKNQDKITLQNIKNYAIAMFMALHQLRKNKIIHADIKPDNFLLTEDLSKIKLTDFGTSFYVEEHNHEIDELVARYYRAPEIILGCEMPIEHRYAIDTWAVGCSLYELFTGSFLFEGQSNNDMLKQIMQTKGKFSTKMLKKCLYFDKYFDNEYNFLHSSYDSNSKTITTKKIQPVITSERELLNLIKKNCKFDQDPKKISVFRDFLQSCLSINPKNRLTPELAFQHPFLNYMIKLQ